jgi:hypothetical protein
MSSRIRIALLVATGLLAACGENGSTGPVPTSIRPVIASFTATPSNVTPGGNATLVWSVTGATSLSIDPGVGTVAGTFTTVSPATTTLYTLTATNAAGASQATATVTVGAASVLEVACSGPSCGAAGPSLYSGSGIGIWRYRNATATPATIAISIDGVRAGQGALLLFSNGATSATTLPSAGALATPPPLALPPEPPAGVDRAQAERDHGHHSMLDRNRELARSLRDLPPAPGTASAAATAAIAAPAPTPAVGDTRTWTDNYPPTPVTYPTVARVVCPLPPGRKAVFWVDPAATTAGNVTDADLAYFQATFCGTAGGYAQVTGMRGDVWGDAVAPWPTIYIQDGVAALQDVHVVFLNVPSGTAWGGYFYSLNNILKTYASPSYATSNEALAFFVNAPGVKSNRAYYASTLLHELTHMVNHYQRSVRRTSPYDTWLEEMSAMMTEDVVTPAVTPDHATKIPGARVGPYVGRGGAVSLVSWGPGVDTKLYEAVGSLGAFLDRRHGLAVYANMVDCPITSTGVACVDSLIRTAGGSGFEDDLARMGASVYGLLPVAGTPAGYGFPEKVAGGFTLGAIDLSAWASIRPATATSLGGAFPATAHTYQLDTVPAGRTTYARAAVVVPAGVTLLVVIR